MKIFLKTAKLAKEKGFDLPCYNSYTEYNKTQNHDNPSFRFEKGEVETDNSFFKNNSEGDYSCEHYTQYAAPQREDLQQWLISKHNLYFVIVPFKQGSKVTFEVFIQRDYFVVSNLTGKPNTKGATFEKAYENALWSCLLKVKNNEKVSTNV